MSSLLAIETSADACSCALCADGDCTADFRVAPQRHAELLLPMIESLLAGAGLRPVDLHALAFTCGPGSFTGLRVGAGVVQGIAFAAGLPVVAVSTLRALAQGAAREAGRERVLAALDARMGEVYWGAYAVDANGLMQPRAPDRVCTPGAVTAPEGGAWHGAGSGWGAHGQALAAVLAGAVQGWDEARRPHALDVATIALAELEAGNAVAAEQALPLYLRDKIV